MIWDLTVGLAARVVGIKRSTAPEALISKVGREILTAKEVAVVNARRKLNKARDGIFEADVTRDPVIIRRSVNECRIAEAKLAYAKGELLGH